MKYLMIVLPALLGLNSFAEENWRCCPSTANPLFAVKEICKKPAESDLVLKLTRGSLAHALKPGQTGELLGGPASGKNFDPYTFVVKNEFNRSYGQVIDLILTRGFSGKPEATLYQYPNQANVNLSLEVGKRIYDCMQVGPSN